LHHALGGAGDQAGVAAQHDEAVATPDIARASSAENQRSAT
jgi:hypothetical protein